MNVIGLHHVTAIASDPQRNLDFYVGVLGLRLVKRTVNFDDPGTYHFYFGDAAGSPGTILTFFPWPHARRGVRGAGEVEATAFAIPTASAEYWIDRLKAHRVPVEQPAQRLGEEVLRLADPDGMLVELIVSSQADTSVWNEGPVPAEHAIRGFHGVTARLDEIGPTARLLREVFGYTPSGQEGNRTRYSAPDGAPGRHVDLLHLPDTGRGSSGAGTVHHIAFRLPNDEAQASARRTISGLGLGVSPIMDRTYFHSIYFREPGGVLFEMATDNPGFAIDESPETLGQTLKLPPWMEKSRERIEQLLPAIELPTEAVS